LQIEDVKRLFENGLYSLLIDPTPVRADEKGTLNNHRPVTFLRAKLGYHVLATSPRHIDIRHEQIKSPSL
jgi:hypothetical protein